MLRQIIRINESLCNGCGLCVSACHEGAIQMKDGKAVLVRDDYCDGLGNCLPVCPTGAISFETREAAAFDEEAVKAMMAGKPAACPGSLNRELPAVEAPATNSPLPSQLKNFPVQLQLVAPNAAFFEGADLLVAADCAAYTHGDFHREYIKGKVCLIGCPKLDHADYAEKLALILKVNSIRSLTLVRMEVPCCGGLERAVETALKASGKTLPYKCVTMGVDGNTR